MYHPFVVSVNAVSAADFRGMHRGKDMFQTDSSSSNEPVMSVEDVYFPVEAMSDCSSFFLHVNVHEIDPCCEVRCRVLVGVYSMDLDSIEGFMCRRSWKIACDDVYFDAVLHQVLGEIVDVGGYAADDSWREFPTEHHDG